MVPGDRQSGGWFHGKVEQGRGGKEPVTACKRGRQDEGREGEGTGGGEGRAAVLIPLSMKAENNG